jgi:hypothetical protein
MRAARLPLPAGGAGSRVESFLDHARWRWAKRAAVLSAVVLLVYVLHDPDPRPNGGTWYGYALGVVATGLIGWLTALGIRKRRVSRRPWSLKGWTSAHVWLGLALVVVATLHTGFEFGRNVHTFAYGLMLAVILSGVVGVIAYRVLPEALSQNRGEQTEPDMLANMRTLDAQIAEAGQYLGSHAALMVRDALHEDVFAGGVWQRLTGRERTGPTRLAREALRREEGAAAERVGALLDRKLLALSQVRRHLALRARLEVWLYVHVPLTIALLAALAAHILSVFFYW